MRVFTVSDIHVDYAENLAWVLGLSAQEYQQDILIVAGDVTDSLKLLQKVLESLQEKFRAVLFVPGNHELWVQADDFDCSLEKFAAVQQLCNRLGVLVDVCDIEGISFVPLLSWYDFSFGKPDRHLTRAWRDFRACRWPSYLPDSEAVSDYFLEKNLPLLDVKNDTVISYSHFLPRIDVMSPRIPLDRRRVYPVLGSDGLGRQVEQLKPDIHVYGHSHVNQSIEFDGTLYVNNAFAYPKEERIARKRLHCIFDTSNTSDASQIRDQSNTLNPLRNKAVS